MNNDNLPDLLVKGKHQLSGAHNTKFWLLVRTKTSYIVVFTELTDALSILKNRTKGFKNIRTDTHTAVQLFTEYFRFDGKKYVYSWGKEENI